MYEVGEEKRKVAQRGKGSKKNENPFQPHETKHQVFDCGFSIYTCKLHGTTLLMDAFLQSPLLRLLGETFDSALATSYRSFAFALAALLEARLTYGAELLLRPALRSVAQILGGSWRQWIIIAAAGLVLRAHRLSSRSIHSFHRHSREAKLTGKSAFAREMYGEGHHSLSPPFPLPTTEMDVSAAIQLPDGSGTWYFVPSNDHTSPEEHRGIQRSSWKCKQPLLIRGPTSNAAEGLSKL